MIGLACEIIAAIIIFNFVIFVGGLIVTLWLHLTNREGDK